MADGPRRFQRSERRPAPGSALAGPSSDITPLPDLVHGRSRAGPVRSERPVYVDLLPPCNSACPAGEDIQTYLAHVKAGEHERAWRVLVEDNPFAAIHGRVCYHPCETSCNRAELDSAVSIHAVERFLGDLALERGWRFDPPPVRSGKRVLVVGAGPSGLSAAYHLARLGHEVEIRDAGPEPGGMMRYGIPAYRMPRDVLSGEVERIAELGVRMIGDHRVEDLEAERREGGFDAVFVAVGAHLSKRVDIPARDAGPIVDAVSFLRSVASGERPVIGRRVAVYGGGNTAMDAARVARRLGAEEALIVYRRTREQMPAHEQEAEDAEREGVRINWLRTIKAFEGPQLQVEVMELDESGYPAADRAVRDARRGHGDPRAGPGDRHRLPARRARGGVRARRHGEGLRLADDRVPGRVRRRRHGARRAHGHGRRGPRQARGAGDRRVAAGHVAGAPAEASAGDVRPAQPVVLRRCGHAARSPSWSRPSASRASRRCSAA